MLKKIEGVTLWSEDHKSLAGWYQKVFGLKVAHEIDVPDDKAIALAMEEGGDQYLWIGFHDKVHGTSKDPYRIMISYFVDSVDRVYETMLENKVKIIAPPHVSPTGELKVLTAMDPEENLIQLFETL